MKKSIIVAFVICLAVQSAGCATVQKKFTRKKKEKPTHAVIYLNETTYQKKYSNDYYYKTHYTMWRTWHSELISQLGGNSKKVARCAQETYSHLVEMQRYLKPEKQGELQPILNSVSQIMKRIDSGTIPSEIPGLRTELEKDQRLIANDFYYEKVKDSLLPDVVDLNVSATPAAPSTGT